MRDMMRQLPFISLTSKCSKEQQQRPPPPARTHFIITMLSKRG